MDRFTGQERDAGTSLDYFSARYFLGAGGRFTRIDPLLASGIPEEPQSWNHYTYGLNNPLKYIDPTGLEWILKDSGNRECVNGCSGVPADSDCRTAIAVQTKSGVADYGSQSADDVTEYAANKAGVVDTGAIAGHPDANSSSAHKEWQRTF